MKDKTTNTQDIQPLYQRIQRKQEILSRIESIRLELNDQTRRKYNLENERNEVRNKVAGFSESPENPLDRAKKTTLEEKAAKLLSEVDVVSRAIDKLKTERQSLEDIELPACIQETGIAEVLEHQGRTQALRAEASRLEEAISAQRGVIDKAKANILKLPDRSSERAEILADIAIGEAKSAKLEKLDAQIAREQKEFEDSRTIAAPIIDHATQTITGLESKLADLTSKIAEQAAKNPEVMEQYLMSEIELVGSQYAEHATALRDAFLRLAGLEDLLNTVASNRRQVIPFMLSIPFPKLDACKFFKPYGNDELMFMAKSIQGSFDRQSSAASERTRIADAGCEIL